MAKHLKIYIANAHRLVHIERMEIFDDSETSKQWKDDASQPISRDNPMWYHCKVCGKTSNFYQMQFPHEDDCKTGHSRAAFDEWIASR